MNGTPRARLLAYGVAVLAVAVSLLMRAYVLHPLMGVKGVYLTFCPAVMIAAYFGGFRPGLLATLLSAVAVDYLFVEPVYNFWFHTPQDTLAVAFFVLVGTFISGLCESLHRFQRRIVANERRYAVTLSSIGDAVIATDNNARVTFLNPVAEKLTGWSQEDATGQPLAEVFRIVNEETRQPVEDPGAKVLRLGAVVGLANHAVLLARDGRELPIDDSAAPIIGDGSDITGVVLVFRDTTERRESEERFRLLVQNSSDIVSLFDVEGTVLFQAPSVERLLGRRPQDRIGRNVFRDPIVHPDDMGRKKGFFDAIRNQPGTPVTAEFRLRHADGSWRDIEAIGQNFLHDASVAGIVANYRDITDRKRAEEKVRASEARFRTLAKATNDAVWDWDLDTNKVWWNEGVFTLFGYALEQNEADPAWWLERVHPDDREAVESFFFDVVRGQEQSWVDEYRFRCADGSYKDVYDRGYVLRDQGGRAVRMIGAMLDITGRKRAEEALRESEHRWRSLTEALPQLVWTATPDGACDYFSTQWSDHTGISESALLGWRWLETLHPDDRETTRQLWTDSVAGRGAYDVEYRVRRLDGEYRWFKTRGVPIRDSADAIFKWFGTCTDITDSKRTEEELRLAKEAAESANRAKDEFLANVSHEIRTPMNAILGMTELVLDTPLTEAQRQSLKTVKAAADNLLGIINDLLDFSKIEAGKLELDPADFSLRAALGDTLRTLAIRAHKKGLELVSHVHPDVPDALVGDAGRLRQVLFNLVGNAIKFTEAGEVVVRVEGADSEGCKATEDRGVASSVTLSPSHLVTLSFHVRDTGIGIAPDNKEKIFRAFEQEDTSTTRKYGGSGLGLTIAARLVALMGGTITVDSEPNRGSTFTFTAQFGRQPHPSKVDAARSPYMLDNLPVLIVDDNATNRHILEEWLRIWRMESVAVGDGVAAMSTLLGAMALGRSYALVLLDARMPDTDGLELAAKIRNRPELSATRIILLTSGDIPGDSARFRELQIDAHLLKPVPQDELLKTIYRVMSRRKDDKVTRWHGDKVTDPRARPATLSPGHPVTLSILVAEDNDFNAQLLEQLLVRRGHRVRLAKDGRKTLSLAEEGGFDLLLLDVHMPELDGFEVAQAIRDRERSSGAHLPIVALTARSRKEDRERCLAAGMDDFLAKPIQAADLWRAIDRIADVAAPDRQSEIGLLDADVLLAACGGDAFVLEHVCQAFRAGLPDQLKAVQDALLERNPLRLRDAAHKLCGMVAAFSTVAGSVASDIEDSAAQDQLEEARPLVGRLATMADELVRLAGSVSVESLQRQKRSS